MCVTPHHTTQEVRWTEQVMARPFIHLRRWMDDQDKMVRSITYGVGEVCRPPLDHDSLEAAQGKGAEEGLVVVAAIVGWFSQLFSQLDRDSQLDR